MRPREVFSLSGPFYIPPAASTNRGMGNSKQRRLAFFKQHPMCCFCGGATPATEEDHIPARHLFRKRQWPEGYAFPACGACNDASADDELAMGFLVRIALSEMSIDDEQELEDAIRKLNDRRKDWFQAMREMSRVEMRQMARSSELDLAQVNRLTGGETCAFEMPPDLLAVPVRYGEKLGRALYYRHTGRIVPATGVVRARALPNTQFMSETFPLESFGILHELPTLVRAGKSLEDQFAYRYGLAIDTPGAGFLIQFRESTVLVILVHEDAEQEAARRLQRQADQDGAAPPVA